MSQLKIGAILSYGNIILTNVMGLLLTPFIIRSLGDSEYGLYTLIGSLIAYLSLMDLGIANTVVRYVAKYRAENDKEGEHNFLGTTLLIYLFISAVLLIAGIAVYFNLGQIFKKSLTEGELDKARIMFVILLFNLSIALPGSMLTAICNAYERFIFPRALTAIRYLVRVAVIFAVLGMGGKAISLVIIDTILSILIIVSTLIFVFRKLPVKFRFNQVNRPMISGIFSYSVWIFVLAITSQFQWQGGQLMLGIVSNTTEVAIYGVGIMLGTYYGAFSSAIAGVFLPKATFMVVNKASETELTDMMIRIGRLSLFVLLFILGGFALYGQQFILLWVGPVYEKSWAISLTIMLVYTIPLVQSFANSLLEANKKVSFKAVTYLIFITAGTLSGYFLYPILGSLGMVVGVSAGWAISIVILNFYYQKVLKLEITRFFSAMFPRMLLFFGIVLLICLGLRYFELPGWLGLLVQITIYSVVYLFVMFRFALSPEERQVFYDLIPKKFKK